MLNNLKKMTIISCMISCSAFAQNQGVKVFIVDDNIDSKALEGKYEVTRKPDVYKTVPNRQKREELFRDTALPQDWDELSKDIFYMDLNNKSLSELAQKYPTFDKKVFIELKNKMKN